MVVTTLMAMVVIWKSWKWTLWATAALMVPFLLIDTTFLSANLLKVFHGGWVPLLIGALVMLVIFTWRKGANILAAKTRRLETPIDELVEALEKRPPTRVPGTAVFLTGDPNSAPTALLHSLKHYKVLHENNVVLTVVIENTPYVNTADRVSIEPLGKSFSTRSHPLWLHGDTERSSRTWHRPQAGMELRHHVDLLLPVAAFRPRRCEVGDAAMAGPDLHLACPKRR